MNNRQFLSGLVIVLMAMSIGMSVYAVEPADTVAINSKIYTVNPKQPWAEYGTDIVYVGDNEGTKAFIGKKTTVAELKGKFMLPGIFSTHEHPLMVMALQSGYDKLRLATGHSTLIHLDDLPRLKELDVIANTFAAKNAILDETIISRLGSQDAAHRV